MTYNSNRHLAVGAIIEVPLRRQKTLGVVVASVKQPAFPTKPIATAFDLPPIPKALLELMVWLQQYYVVPVGIVAKQFLPRSLPRRPVSVAERDTTAIGFEALPPLTAEQRLALQRMRRIDTYVLHGRTGSGKTRMYIELTKKVLKKGKSVLVLSPEIGLTSQLAVNFRDVYGARVTVLHSQLTPKERETNWLNILRATAPQVVIGPRSALFSPLSHVGLLIVDEAHDAAYKQTGAPYYHAVRVASSMSRINKALLVLGSATPSITDYYMALEKRKPIIRLEKLALPNHMLHKITVVDLKDRDQFTRAPHLSVPLLKAMSQSLKNGEQALLYLNRRGTARVTLCQNCGWQARCPRCDLPLIYHSDIHSLRCHVCGYSELSPVDCPRCAYPSISFHAFGTKAIVEEVRRLFPEARIVRFDTDNPKTERLENQYQHIVSGGVDIMIGTQVLAKGLDLPRLSTLGVILADSSLSLPDFTAQERTYQLLTQVLGRIGRGHIPSRAIIQTYNPENTVIQAVLSGNWNRFYEHEIKERQQYFFPPFSHIVKLTCRRASADSAEKAAQAFKERLAALKLDVRIDGPAPAFHEKSNGKYLWQLVLKASRRGQLLTALAHLPSSGWTYDLDPVDLL